MTEDFDQVSVVGTKQVLKAVTAGKADCVYLATDVDAFLYNKLKALCYEHHVAIHEIDSMKALGEACKIDVGAACAAVLKTN